MVPPLPEPPRWRETRGTPTAGARAAAGAATGSGTTAPTAAATAATARSRAQRARPGAAQAEAVERAGRLEAPQRLLQPRRRACPLPRPLQRQPQRRGLDRGRDSLRPRAQGQTAGPAPRAPQERPATGAALHRWRRSARRGAATAQGCRCGRARHRSPRAASTAQTAPVAPPPPPLAAGTQSSSVGRGARVPRGRCDGRAQVACRAGEATGSRAAIRRRGLRSRRPRRHPRPRLLVTGAGPQLATPTTPRPRPVGEPAGARRPSACLVALAAAHPPQGPSHKSEVR